MGDVRQTGDAHARPGICSRRVLQTAALLVAGYITASGGDAPARSGKTDAVIGGVFLAVGAVAYYRGFALGSATVVSTLIGLFFVVAAIVGILILGESLQLTGFLGFGFAVLAVVFIAI